MSVSLLNTFICSPVAASRRYERPAPRPRAATFPRARVTFYRRIRLDTRRGRAASDPRDSPSDGQLAAALRPEASRASPRRAAPVPAPPASSARPAARRSARRRARARGARPSARRVAPCSPPPGWALCFCRAPRPRRLRPPTWTTWRRGRWRARRCSRRRARRPPRKPPPRPPPRSHPLRASDPPTRERTRARRGASRPRRRRAEEGSRRVACALSVIDTCLAIDPVRARPLLRRGIDRPRGRSLPAPQGKEIPSRRFARRVQRQSFERTARIVRRRSRCSRFGFSRTWHSRRMMDAPRALYISFINT